METETVCPPVFHFAHESCLTIPTCQISSLNAVRLLLADLWGANATICQETENATHASDGTIMIGWDC